ncbi:Ypt35 protein [Saccharomycopsis crataegensis]|uniref:Endosomal/vacuolar adapter protein YPT35 n=1 Tax=Saccharomycopsis crataegensis TaxID=43959 RepID=A0AAV5QS09_9ASCO|nr:Ypt35 protein [Saccharomycopsis crataegensis]
MRQRANSTQIRLANQPPIHIQLVNNAGDASSDSVGEGQDIATVTSPLSPSGQPWARNLYIGDCTLVRGSGAYRYAVWTITIETSAGSKYTIYKRYSDFVNLRELLIRYFPRNKPEVPDLPQKRFFNNLDNDFLQKRRMGLEYFLSSVMLNPVFSRSAIIKEFVLAK